MRIFTLGQVRDEEILLKHSQTLAEKCNSKSCSWSYYFLNRVDFEPIKKMLLTHTFNVIPFFSYSEWIKLSAHDSDVASVFSLPIS